MRKPLKIILWVGVDLKPKILAEVTCKKIGNDLLQMERVFCSTAILKIKQKIKT